MKKLILFFILWLTLFPIESHANKAGLLSSDLSVKELGNNIKKLKEEKEDLNTKNLEKNKEYWDLATFLKADLTSAQNTSIQNEIQEYLELRDSLELDIQERIKKWLDTTPQKNQIIEEKSQLYKFLYQYVHTEKRQNFLQYINYNIEAEKERKQLIEEITKSQIILDKKVSDLKNKIETHKEQLSQQLEQSLTNKILERLEEIDNNEKYKDLPKEIKNKIYQNFIQQINEKIKEVEESKLSKNYKEVRLKILNKMVSEIEKRKK